MATISSSAGVAIAAILVKANPSPLVADVLFTCLAILLTISVLGFLRTAD